MKIPARQSEHATRDLGEAAYLLARGAAFLRIQRGSQFSLFIFGDAQCCSALSQDYWCGKAVVSAREYNLALRQLKDHLFAGKQSIRRSDGPETSS